MSFSGKHLGFFRSKFVEILVLMSKFVKFVVFKVELKVKVKIIVNICKNFDYKIKISTNFGFSEKI